MDDQTIAQPNDKSFASEYREDIQGNLYEFYLLLQKLKAGGVSFDTFLEHALEWAIMCDITARRP
jgi:hypothetical protein